MKSDGQKSHSLTGDKDEEHLDMYEPEPSDDNNNDFTPESEPINDDATVHWVADEYIEEDRNWVWYVLFVIVVVVLIGIGWYLSAWTFAILVAVMAIALAIFVSRPPRKIEYTLSVGQGLYIGERLYHFSDFKAFGLIYDRGQNSILLIPVKRFEPGVSVYFPDEVGENIIDILGARLPMQDVKLDMIDIVVRKLRL